MKSVSSHRRETIGLAVLFGLLYFVQGIAEPTEGLISQPVRSLLDDWGLSASWIGAFSFVISLPWSMKPLFGFLSDFVPIYGSRRKSYLLIASSSACVFLLLLFLFPPQPGAYGWLLLGILVPTMGVAMSDVTVDALMVEKGQPRGITGQLQSVQWAAMYTATILTGYLGGWLSERRLQSWGFLICSLAILPAIVLVATFVHEEPVSIKRGQRKEELRLWWRAIRQRDVLTVCGFLLLWNFNPFSSSVLQLYMTKELGLSETFFGSTISLQAVASVVASLLYGMYCRRVPLMWLVHASIVCGILATLGYWFMFDERSAVVVSLVVGFIYMTGTLIQLDLAARTCPIHVAASVFALFMAVSNLGYSLSPAVGGYLYDLGAELGNRTVSFRVLVGGGALTTACCWFLVPRLPPDFRQQNSGAST